MTNQSNGTNESPIAVISIANPRPAVHAELERIEEDCVHSGKAHFNAGVRWTRNHYWLGIPSVMLSALAGAAFFKNYGDIAGTMSAIVAILTSLMTFLKPSERASSHKVSGDSYLALRNDVRVFREVKLPFCTDAQTAISGLDDLAKRRNELNQASAQFSKSDFKLARIGIERGEATHQIDQKQNR
jgi:hypothetical protein